MFSLNSHLASGNYSLLYKQQLRTGGVGLAPIGRFYLNQTDSLRGLPFLRLDQNISWPTGSVPLDQPVCGFQGELCPSDDYCDIAIGVVGGLLGVMLVVGGVAYRNWRYEQGICYSMKTSKTAGSLRQSDLDIEGNYNNRSIMTIIIS